jgi:hypothetical protein
VDSSHPSSWATFIWARAITGRASDVPGRVSIAPHSTGLTYRAGIGIRRWHCILALLSTDSQRIRPPYELHGSTALGIALATNLDHIERILPSTNSFRRSRITIFVAPTTTSQIGLQKLDRLTLCRFGTNSIPILFLANIGQEAHHFIVLVEEPSKDCAGIKSTCLGQTAFSTVSHPN